MSRLKIAIIGCGGINTRHADYLITLPDQVELLGFVDTNLEKAVQMAEKYGSRNALVFNDHTEMFEKVRPDVIVIGIPPFAHTDQVKIAAQRGVHIFIEKPIAMTPQKAWEMVDQVESAGVTTQVGFMYRFGAAVERLKELRDSGAAGSFGLASARYFCNSLHAPWWRHRDQSGGQVFEQAIHMVDLMRYLLGEPSSVYCLQNNFFHKDIADYTVEDVSGTVFGFKSGAVGVLNATNGAIPGRWEYDMRVVSKNVTAQLDSANQATLTYTNEPELRVEPITSDQDVYRLEMDEFLMALQTGAKTRTPMREGARTLEMGAAAARSALSHSEEHF